MDEIQDHPGYLISVPGHLPQVGIEDRLLQPLLIFFVTPFTGAPVILEGLRSGLEDGSRVFRSSRADLQTLGQGEVGNILQIRPHHLKRVTYWLVAFFN